MSALIVLLSAVCCFASYTMPEETPYITNRTEVCDFDEATWTDWNGVVTGWQLTENIQGGGEATAVRAADLNGTPICWLNTVLESPIDLSAYNTEDLYLHFWIYLEDASSIIGDGVIEFTSAGTCDVEACAIAFSANSGLVNGWNEISAPFTDFNVLNANLSNINYFRIYFFTSNANNAMALNDMYFGIEGEEPVVTDSPVTDSPVTDSPVTDSPVTDTPVTDESSAEFPVTDEPEDTASSPNTSNTVIAATAVVLTGILVAATAVIKKRG